MRALSPRSQGFFKTVRLPQVDTREKNRSVNGSRCGAVLTGHKTQNSDSLERNCPFSGDKRRTLEKNNGPNVYHNLFGLDAGWEPNSPVFWHSPAANATLDGALFCDAQIVDSFSTDTHGDALVETTCWSFYSLTAGMEKGITTDFAGKRTN